jgi:hypothetical protein
VSWLPGDFRAVEELQAQKADPKKPGQPLPRFANKVKLHICTMRGLLGDDRSSSG